MEFFNPASLSNIFADYGDIAMSRGQARQIVDRYSIVYNKATLRNG